MKSWSLLLLFVVLVSANQDLDWWQHGVFYQIYPRSFRDSDGDGIGDIRGITENLEHLVDLGVTGFWLGPVFKSPMMDGGYDIEDFREVDPIFGNMTDLRALITRAHQLNLKVILDFVPNHTSDRHEWFQLSQNNTPGYQNYYLWRDCPLEADGSRRMPNNWVSVFHTRTWTYSPARNECYLHQFTPHQPDLNYRNPAVRNAMLGHARFWFQQGIDGLRVDAIHVYETEGLTNEVYVNINGDRNSRANLILTSSINRPESFEFMQDLRKIADEFSTSATVNHTRIIIADTNAPLQTQLLWYGNETDHGAHIPLNFAFFGDIGRTSTPVSIRDRFLDMQDIMPFWGEPNWVLGNHDTSRVGYRFGEGRHESLAIFTLMMPGPAMIYYGEEIRMTDHRGITFEESDDPHVRQTNQSVFMQFSRDPARTPFQWDNTSWAGFSNTTFRTWLPVHPNYREVNLMEQKEADKSTYKLYKTLIELRGKYKALQIGSYSFSVVDRNLIGFVRTLQHHPTVAVLINVGPTGSSTSLREFLKDEYSVDVSGTILAMNTNSTLSFGMRLGGGEEIHLGPYDAIVVEVSSAGKVAVTLTIIFSSLLMLIL